jgi:hypothetical protein
MNPLTIHIAKEFSYVLNLTEHDKCYGSDDDDINYINPTDNISLNQIEQIDILRNSFKEHFGKEILQQAANLLSKTEKAQLTSILKKIGNIK